MSLIVQAVGPQTLIQDRGRSGYANLAITTSGAMDRTSFDRANRIVGNSQDAAGLEILMGSFTARASTDVTLAVTGAPVAITVTTARGKRIQREMNSAILLHAHDTISLGVPVQGLRSYLAVRGGIDVPPVLGSRASDPTTGIGPTPVAVGDELTVGTLPATTPPLHDLGAISLTTHDLVLTGTWGPRADWFTQAAQRALTATRWQVTSQANRVGVRLEGAPLEREITAELPSEGLVRGAVQVPANGQPLVFSSDHPTTGGYPVIAVVDPYCVDLLAQARPGTSVQFRLRTMPEL